MMKRLTALLLALVLLMSMSAFALSETRTFTDDLGREVTVPTEISRIMVSGPLPH